MKKTQSKKALREDKLKRSMAVFKNIDHKEFNNGLHWQFDLGYTIYNFFPTTHKWYTSYIPNQKMKRGTTIETFCMAIRLPLEEKTLKPKNTMARSQNEHNGG